MQKRYIIAAVIGGLVGFCCQFAFDNLMLRPVYKNSSGECEWVPTTQSQFVFLASGNINRYVAMAVPYNEFYARGKELVYQQMLLLWVRDRAELAGRTAILTGFWFALVVLAADQLSKFVEKRRRTA